MKMIRLVVMLAALFLSALARADMPPAPQGGEAELSPDMSEVMAKPDMSEVTHAKDSVGCSMGESARALPGSALTTGRVLALMLGRRRTT